MAAKTLFKQLVALLGVWAIPTKDAAVYGLMYLNSSPIVNGLLNPMCICLLSNIDYGRPRLISHSKADNKHLAAESRLRIHCHA